MNIKAFLKKNSSTILTITSVVGVVVTAISTANATIKATQLITEKEDTTGESLTTKDKIKLVVPAYIPPVLFGVGTATCIVGSNILNKKSQVSMMSAYALIDQSYKDYKRKLKELYGEEAHERILDELNAERAEKRYISNGYMFSSCDTYVE